MLDNGSYSPEVGGIILMQSELGSNKNHERSRNE